MFGHQHISYFLHNRELDELYISVAIRSFSLSMIVIFIPIYLLNLGYTLKSVFLLYAMLCLFRVLSVVPIAKISSKYGFKHVMIFSIPFLIISYLLLYTIEIYRWPLILMAFTMALGSEFFWIGYHIDFCKSSDEKERGEEVGIERILVKIFHIIGPFIGGLILTFLGFKILFVFVSIFLFVSMIPLFFSSEIHEPINFSLKNILKLRDYKNILPSIGKGVEQEVGYVIWPVFIFFYIIKSYSTLGFVFSLGFFFSVIFMYIISELSDIRRRLVLRIGAFSNFIIWIIRIFITKIMQVFFIDAVYGMSQSAIDISFNAIIYDRAGKRNIVGTIVRREIFVYTGGGLVFFIMYFVTNLRLGFVLTGLASLLHFLF